MNLQEFLKTIHGNKDDIINYAGDKALKIVKRDGSALRYVKEQTEAVCLEAVKQEDYALQYVDKSVFIQKP